MRRAKERQTCFSSTAVVPDATNTLLAVIGYSAFVTPRKSAPPARFLPIAASGLLRTAFSMALQVP